jgi:hypothetical protein
MEISPSFLPPLLAFEEHFWTFLNAAKFSHPILLVLCLLLSPLPFNSKKRDDSKSFIIEKALSIQNPSRSSVTKNDCEPKLHNCMWHHRLNFSTPKASLNIFWKPLLTESTFFNYKSIWLRLKGIEMEESRHRWFQWGALLLQCFRNAFIACSRSRGAERLPLALISLKTN